MDVSENKVLLIAYHFPPDAAVGALRPQKFAKYLPEFGWEPHVLTIRERHIEKKDESRLSDIAGAKIHRTAYWRTPLQLGLDIRDRLRGYRSDVAIKGLPTGSKNTTSNEKEALFARLKRYFVALNWFPDDKLWWAIPAVASGYFLIRRERIPVIYATSPPPTVAIIGYLLSLMTGASLIVDFRDPWVVAKDSSSDHIQWPLLNNWKKTLERTVFKRADRIICTTEYYKRALVAHYHDILDDKFITIPNGYDEDDFPSCPVGKNTKYTITYLGTFYLDRSPRTIFMAMQKLILQGDISADDVEIRLFGNVEYAGGESVREMAKQYGLVDQTFIMGFVSHQEAMQQMSSADLLLLLAPEQPFQIPAKAFEYIGVRRPILALTDEGATSDLVQSVNAGLIVSQEDVSGIAGALKVFYAERQNSLRWYRGLDVASFERRNLTLQLADVLEMSMRFSAFVSERNCR